MDDGLPERIDSMATPVASPVPHTCTFREKGRYESEVTLRFDDGEELYVATDFLKMTSPVFEKMLEGDYKEKNSGVIEMVEKDRTDVLELLNYFHPSVQKRVTQSSVFKLLLLAEEYGMTNLVSECRTLLLSMLTKIRQGEKFHTDWADNKSVSRSHCNSLSTCFAILDLASLFSYTDIEKIAVDTISQFPSNAYIKEKVNTKGVKQREKVNKLCVNQYSNLKDTLKIQILQERLNSCDASCSVATC